uniref:StAR-related lipid transfer (START) domain containing 8 n=1 Tax=Cyprinus carpio TaxID=7962 RepID=A0A8C1UBH2_CYPCA
YVFSHKTINIYSSLFPIEISAVRRDHEFLDQDSLKALCRRLTTLNKCAVMSLEVHFQCKQQSEDSEEDDACALSSRWAFQRESKTWSRLRTLSPPPAPAANRSSTLRPSGSSDSVLSDNSLEVTSLTSDLSASSLSLESARETTFPEVAAFSDVTVGEGASSVCLSTGQDENDDTGSSSSLPSVREKPKRPSRSFLWRKESIKKQDCETEMVPRNISTVTQHQPPSGLHCTSDASLPGQTTNKCRIAKDVAWRSHTKCRSNVSQKSTQHKPHRACLYLEDYQLTWEIPKLTNQNNCLRKEDHVVHLPFDHKPGTFPKSLSIESLCPLSVSQSPDHIDWTGEDGDLSLDGSISCSGSQDFLSGFGRRRNSLSSRSKGWHHAHGPDNTELAYKKVGDGHPMRLWRVSVEIEAPPTVVLQRVLRERHLWDEDLLHSRVIETLENNTEVFHYITDSMAPHPRRNFIVLRRWCDLPKGVCVLVSSSVDHDNVQLEAGLRAVLLTSRIFIEPCGMGRSRLTHYYRADLRGRSPDWYNKVFGHLCAMEVARIRSSFPVLSAQGPETKI